MSMQWVFGNSRPFMYAWMGQWGMPFWIIPIALWSALWTGFVLWHAARRHDVWWFIFFLFVHTGGLAEILYLLFVAHAFDTKKSQRRS